MKKREVAWHILFYNIRMNVKFEYNDAGINQHKLTYFFEITIILLNSDRVVACKHL